MRLQIKTLNQKSLMIDVEPSKTVYDLKRELSLYPDVGVRPELQKLIYAGKILSNEEPLSAYNIDVKKFLVVMVLKQPIEDASATGESEATTSGAAVSSAAPAASEELKEPRTPTAEASKPAATVAAVTSTPTETIRQPASETDEMVANIVSMGYPESEVRRALAASFNTPERAIEYLIEGIPDSVVVESAEDISYAADASSNVLPFEIFRTDPMFRNLRRAIQQNPELIDHAIQSVGDVNPAMLNLINENQQEFLCALLEGSEDEDDDEGEEERGGGGM